MRRIPPTLLLFLAALGVPASASAGTGGATYQDGAATYGQTPIEPDVVEPPDDAPTTEAVRGHRFPIAGPFTYSGPAGRFGAPRPGHAHQGQDLIAAEGTRVVAPRRGRVKFVGYQAKGAGYYVIIDGAGERLDYAFFHLQAGSIRVRQGQYVRMGARVARVGNTGRSFGAHLHFEIWRGPWFGGGKAIDPLPLLRRWDDRA